MIVRELKFNIGLIIRTFAKIFIGKIFYAEYEMQFVITANIILKMKLYLCK